MYMGLRWNALSVYKAQRLYISSQKSTAEIQIIIRINNNTMAFWHISLARYLKNVMVQSYLSKFIFIFLVTPSAAGSHVSCNLFESVCQWLMTLISFCSLHRAIVWLQKLCEKHLNHIYIYVNSFSRHICPKQLTFMMFTCPDSLYMILLHGKEQAEHSSYLLLLCSTEDSKSYRFGRTWGYVKYHRTFILGELFF